MAEKLQLRAEITRRKILDTAVEKFAAAGLSGTTVDDIAIAAGVNKQRIYAYFGSKQKLFEAALLAVFSQVKFFSGRAVKAAAADPAKLSRIMLEDFLQIHREHPALWRLLAWANLQGADSAAVLAGVRREENEALREIFETARERNLIKAVKFENWLFSLLALSCFYYSNYHTMQYTHDPGIADEKWRTLLLDDVELMFTP